MKGEGGGLFLRPSCPIVGQESLRRPLCAWSHARKVCEQGIQFSKDGVYQALPSRAAKVSPCSDIEGVFALFQEITLY